VNIPLNHLQERIAEIPRDRRIAVHCAGGYRSSIAASILRGGNPAWSNWKRGQDYYQEGELLWLDADTLIRKLTDNKKSLDDFEHIFLGKGGNTGPSIVTYDRAELIADLNEVVKYDWANFLHERIDGATEAARESMLPGELIVRASTAR